MGRPECNLVASSCGALFPARPGWIGRAVPGHEVAVRDGEIAVRAPDPVMMLRYWNRPEETAAKYRDGWLMTGDAGEMDAEGFIRFTGRRDDVITSAGYRIGPAEIEDCLLRHPAVAMAAVFGVPDAMRTEAVAAAVVLRPGEQPSDELAARLQNHVRTRLSAHLYPRYLRFVAELPLTATGKIMRKALREAWTPRITSGDDPNRGRNSAGQSRTEAEPDRRADRNRDRAPRNSRARIIGATHEARRRRLDPVAVARRALRIDRVVALLQAEAGRVGVVRTDHRAGGQPRPCADGSARAGIACRRADQRAGCRAAQRADGGALPTGLGRPAAAGWAAARRRTGK
jgi:hypothetical protein